MRSTHVRLIAAATAFAGAVAVRSVLAPDGRVGDHALPQSALSVRNTLGEWEQWWRSDDAPSRWDHDAVLSAAPLSRAISWRRAADGLEWGEVELSGTGEAWRTRLVVARVDPRVLRLSLDTAFLRGRRADWSVDRAPANALLAVNAGQFEEALPWGWVVLGGRQFLRPAGGPLAAAIVIDTAGRVRWVQGDSVQSIAMGQRTDVAWAFESFPVILHNGEIPAPVRGQGNGVDVEHRDARVALGMVADGTVLIALTRFDLAGETLGALPFGLTTPEMAAVMGALGSRHAVLLDGGISGQMLIRDAAGERHSWPGLRRVPLALVATPRIHKEEHR